MESGTMKRVVQILSFMFISFFIFALGISYGGPVNTDQEGVAIKGYDAVAYFTRGMAVAGKKDFQHNWNNARWYFSNADHLELFKTGSGQYAPQYGGY